MAKDRLLARAVVVLISGLIGVYSSVAPSDARGSRAARGLANAVAIDPAPKPTTRSPRNGQTVSGRIRWRVSYRGPRPRRLDLVVDGEVRVRLRGHGGSNRLARRAGVATLDTTSLTDGPHVLAAIAYDSRGHRSGRSAVRVKVENLGSGEPSVPANGPGSVYWGAWIGDQLTGAQAPWDMTAVSAFEELADKQLSIIQFGTPFANCASSPCAYYDFPLTPMNDIRGYGAIPFLSWSSQSLPSSLNQPNFQLSDVIGGAHDSYIRSFATAAKQWGHPFFLRFNWEMNGAWFSWSERANGNRPGEYVAAWRHVHDIFESVGATNASWVWCPNVDPHDRLQDLAPLYPGDDYVDWTCLDGYNWGTNRAGINPTSPQIWRSFDQLYGSTYQEITEVIAPSKPMIVAEIGSSEHGGSKAAWIENMLGRLPSYPRIRGMLWFEVYADNMDWPIETSGLAVDAFSRGIQNAAYTSNTFGDLSGPILPPG
jgi:Glycosyl hydrolase family 26